MRKPTPQSWTDGETVTAGMMRDRITDPQPFYGRKPFFAARGGEANSRSPRSGTALYKGKFSDMKFKENQVWASEFKLTQDRTGLIVPEDGVYHVFFQAGVFSNWTRPIGTNVHAQITADTSSKTAAKGEIALSTQQKVSKDAGHSVSVGVTEFFARGTVLKARVYLDSGASGLWVVSDSEYDTGFYAFMLCPNSDGWTHPSPGPPPELKRWVNGELLNAKIMNEQTIQQFKALDSLPRVTGRGVELTHPGDRRATSIAWNTAYSNHNELQLYGENVTVPWEGLYLVVVSGAARHSAQPAPDVQSPFYVALQVGSSVRQVVQAGNLRTNHESGVLISDLLFLQAGNKLLVRFAGSHQGSEWTMKTGSEVGKDRWWTISVVFLGRS